MNNNIEDLKKKIIYRSNYRGTKEMDLLMSSFTKKYIDSFNKTELKYLSDLLELDDESLIKINKGFELPNRVKSNNVIQLFIDFNN